MEVELVQPLGGNPVFLMDARARGLDGKLFEVKVQALTPDPRHLIYVGVLKSKYPPTRPNNKSAAQAASIGGR